MKKINYLQIYKFDYLNDGSPEKMTGRLDVLIWELSLRTKLGCYDITMPVYLPEKMFTLEKQKEYEIAKKNYKLRTEKLSKLIDLIKSNVLSDKVIDGEYLYELWISKIFELNWKEDNTLNDPVDEIEVLYKQLLVNSEVNPFDIVINNGVEVKRKNKVFQIFKKR